VRHFQIAGNPLELLLPNQIRNYLCGQDITWVW